MGSEGLVTSGRDVWRLDERLYVDLTRGGCCVLASHWFLGQQPTDRITAEFRTVHLLLLTYSQISETSLMDCKSGEPVGFASSFHNDFVEKLNSAHFPRSRGGDIEESFH